MEADDRQAAWLTPFERRQFQARQLKSSFYRRLNAGHGGDS
jgi:hypothetical protein